ncbi:MAG: Signal recognition particle receptor FtsY [Alphaproteobacteria bacterium ADurb.Bin438]|nr:MAG: Signal recognition particle receptor FtsY [Alphaproteobacteria bacterium ADurb.Bin438]
MADVGYDTASSLVMKLAKKRYEKEVSDKEVREIIASDISEILDHCEGVVDFDNLPKPFVILMVGVNGSGKTTTIGKLARMFKDKGLTVSMVAGDTFRAAAVEQLSVWAKRTDAFFLSGKIGADASGLVFESLNTALEEKHDVVLIDTAGRLHNRKDLMLELQKVVRVIKKVMPFAPHLTLQVIDATVGQNAHSQIQNFKEMVDVNGLVVTKLDGTAKGGVLVSISEKQKVPTYFIGAGEKITDMKPFNAKDYAKGIMGIDEE